MAVVAPSPFIHLFALALQAIYAAEPLRTAFMSLRTDDIRLRYPAMVVADGLGMENYWRGGSPRGLVRPTPEQWQQINIGEQVRENADGASCTS